MEDPTMFLTKPKSRSKLAVAAFAAAATLTLAGIPAANAALILEVTDGTTTKRVVDGGAGDGSGVEGIVLFNDVVGDFIINIATGSSKPVIGTTDKPRLDLNSVNINGFGTGEVTISLTDTDFVGSNGALARHHSFIGGTTDGDVEFETFLDNRNREFGTGTRLSSMSLTGNPFSGSEFVSATTSDLFSLTIVTTITHNGIFNITSFDGSIAVPEPGTLGIVGAGLLLLQLSRRRAVNRS